MSYILGIDTGGTYTDGVLIDPASRTVHGSGKAFTTYEDLSVGIHACLRTLPRERLEQAAMICLSTTLATNAVVEGRSGRVGVFLLGRTLDQPLPAAKCAFLQGELDIKGRQRLPLDLAQARRAAEEMRGQIDAAAVSGFASVRNPAHERAVRDLIREILGVPVVCANELSRALGFYERTVTAALNAGLIPRITELIHAVKSIAAVYGLGKVPLMIVKGDGSLMRSEYALERPIETVLSGPAASVVGGRFLTGLQDALVVDVGGTTTDIASICGGKAALNPSGAVVGGWRTQLRAVDIHTYGLGGDSRITLDRMGKLAVGPRRVLPLCVAGTRSPGLAEELRRYRSHTRRELAREQYAECYHVLRPGPFPDCSKMEMEILRLLGDSVHSLFWLEEQGGIDAETVDLEHLIQLGALQCCGLTPTDLLHVSGTLAQWDAETSKAGAEILALRQGKPLPDFLEDARRQVEASLQTACLHALLDGNAEQPEAVARFLTAGSPHGALRVAAEVSQPVIALGAPVAAWMPQVCQALHAELVIPSHAEVANAVGAAVGNVSVEASALIRPDQYHKMLVVHGPWGTGTVSGLEQAEQDTAARLEAYAAEQARKAGGGNIETTRRIQRVSASRMGTEEKVFIETRISAVAVGSPAWEERSG